MEANDRLLVLFQVAADPNQGRAGLDVVLSGLNSGDFWQLFRLPYSPTVHGEIKNLRSGDTVLDAALRVREDFAAGSVEWRHQTDKAAFLSENRAEMSEDYARQADERLVVKLFIASLDALNQLDPLSGLLEPSVSNITLNFIPNVNMPMSESIRMQSPEIFKDIPEGTRPLDMVVKTLVEMEASRFGTPEQRKRLHDATKILYEHGAMLSENSPYREALAEIIKGTYAVQETDSANPSATLIRAKLETPSEQLFRLVEEGLAGGRNLEDFSITLKAILRSGADINCRFEDTSVSNDGRKSRIKGSEFVGFERGMTALDAALHLGNIGVPNYDRVAKCLRENGGRTSRELTKTDDPKHEGMFAKLTSATISAARTMFGGRA